jgi:hypothetical protein
MPLSGTPHGLIKKTRRRADSDDEEDSENIDPDQRSPMKKLKPTGTLSGTAAEEKMDLSKAGAVERRRAGVVDAKGKGLDKRVEKGKGFEKARESRMDKVKRGVLSLSRLNMLARPKGKK